MYSTTELDSALSFNTVSEAMLVFCDDFFLWTVTDSSVKLFMCVCVWMLMCSESVIAMCRITVDKGYSAHWQWPW